MRLRPLVYIPLILVVLLALISVPVILQGQSEASQAEQALAAKNFSLAAEYFERAATHLPWRPDLRESAGIWKAASDDFDTAISLLEQARREQGDLSDNGWFVLGVAYEKTGEREMALQTWQMAVEQRGVDAVFSTPIYSRLADLYRIRGNFIAEQDALEHWAASGGADDGFDHYRLGLLLADTEPDRALDELRQAASIDPIYDSAVQTLRASLNLASLESDPSRQFVIIGRGLGLVNEWNLAERSFQQAVDRDEKNAEAWAWLGEAEQHLGRDGAADFKRAYLLDPSSALVRSMYALYWMRQDRPDLALLHYRAAATLEPDNPAWQAAIGDALTQSGELHQALAAYYHAAELAPKDPAYLRLLAMFCTQYQLYVEEMGLPAAQKAIDLEESNALSRDTLGWVYLNLNKPEEARRAFEKALELDPELVSAYLHLGILELQQSHSDAALADLKRVLALDADGPAGQQAQALLDRYFP
jgi:tetratricopeptide (TPR) repeat protein